MSSTTFTESVEPEGGGPVNVWDEIRSLLPGGKFPTGEGLGELSNEGLLAGVKAARQSYSVQVVKDAETAKRVETITRLIDDYSQRLRLNTLIMCKSESHASLTRLAYVVMGAIFFSAFISMIPISKTAPRVWDLPLPFNIAIAVFSALTGGIFSVYSRQAYHRFRLTRSENEIIIRHLRKLLTRATELTESGSGLSFEQRIELDFRVADVEALIVNAEHTSKMPSFFSSLRLFSG